MSQYFDDATHILHEAQSKSHKALLLARAELNKHVAQAGKMQGAEVPFGRVEEFDACVKGAREFRSALEGVIASLHTKYVLRGCEPNPANWAKPAATERYP